MKHFKIGDFSDRSGRIWFNADKYENIPSSLEVTAEEFTFEATTVNYDRSGDITANLGTFAGDFRAIRKIKVDFEPPEIACSGTFVEQYNEIDVSFAELSCDMGSGRGLNCEFELAELIFNEVINMATMELVFKEPTSMIIGDNSYIYMSGRLEDMECEMHVGTSLAVELHELTMTGVAVNGATGSISCRARRMDLSMLGGVPTSMTLTGVPLEIDVSGDTPIICSLDLTAREALCEMLGLSSIGAGIDVRFKLMSVSMDGDVGPVANIKVYMSPARVEMTSREHITADLDGTISIMKLKAGLLVDGPNTIDLVLEEPVMFVDEDSGDCAAAEILTYGG